MKYLIYNNKIDLNIRNEQIAQSQSCLGNITKYWFTDIKHPTQDLWALCVDDEKFLTEQEKIKLKTYDDLLADGWFQAE